MSHHVAALPYRFDPNGSIELLLVGSEADDDKWLAPEGLMIDGLAPHDAAAGEAFEETGVFGHTWRRPLGQYTPSQVPFASADRATDVTVFPLRVQGRLPDRPAGKFRESHWFDAQDAIDLVGEVGLAQLIAHFQPPPDVLELWNQDPSSVIAGMEAV